LNSRQSAALASNIAPVIRSSIAWPAESSESAPELCTGR
jgi:hypothetical protein